MLNSIDKAKLDKYNEHITNLEKLFKSVNIKGTYEQFRLAPCFMLFNFIDLLRAVAVLDNNHMVTSGSIIIRSMFEIILDFLYCETNRKKLYERFGKYQYVNKVNLYNILPDYLKVDVNKEQYENITLKEYESFKKEYNIIDKRKLNNWCGLSIKERVDLVSKINPEIIDLYLNIYKITCDYTHPSATTICEYSKLVNQGINMSYERKYNLDKYLLIRQVNSMVEIFYNKFNNNYANKKLAEVEF